MEEARKEPAASETKQPETDSRPVAGEVKKDDAKQDSAAASAAGSGESKKQAADKAAEEFSKPPADDQGKDAAHDSKGESDGKSQKQAGADGGGEPALDAKTQKLVDARIDARVKSLLESELEPLLSVNRQLARFLREQMEIAIELRQSVVAMEQFIEADPRRKGKYAAMLEKVKSEGDGMADPHWINRTRGMLSQLERTGTTGPKIEGETKQS